MGHLQRQDYYEKKRRRRNGILLPKLFLPTVRKKCSSDWEKFLKFEAEGWEFAKILRSLEQFFLTVGKNNFGNKIPFSIFSSIFCVFDK